MKKIEEPDLDWILTAQLTLGRLPYPISVRDLIDRMNEKKEKGRREEKK